MNASRSPLQSNLLPEDDTVLPLVIIGAGPQAAMLLSYLNSPFQQVTGDDERVFQRYQDWMARKAKTSAAPAQQLFQTPPVVIDDSGAWLTRWKQNFAALEIPFLRSPLAAHIDMRHRESLLAYTSGGDGKARSSSYSQARSTRDFASTPSKKQKKAKRAGQEQRREQHGNATLLEWQEVPSNSVFLRHASDTLKSLEGTYNMVKASVTAISMEPAGDGTADTVAVLQLSNGSRLKARHVVLAVGQNVRAVPAWALPMLSTPLSERANRLLHSSELYSALSMAGGRPGAMPGDDAFAALYRGRSVMVVGGGLSAAHICLSAARHGASKVVLLTRKALRIRPLDVGLEWFDRLTQRRHLCKFLQSTPAQRADMVRSSRGGGSITGDVYAQLLTLVENGRLSMLQNTTIGQLIEHEDGTCTPICTAAQPLGRYDLVVLATGSTTNPQQHPLMSLLMKAAPVDVIAGFPVVTPELRWRRDCPIYVMGTAAALQIGPDSGNLSGGRRAAELIGDDLRERLEAEWDEEDADAENDSLSLAGAGNMYALLACAS